MKKGFLLVLQLVTIAVGFVVVFVVFGFSPENANSAEKKNKSKAQKTWSSLPGVATFEDGLLQKFEALKRVRGKDYKPRTRHLRPGGWAKYTNRLFLESSPYLIQHAHNPVNWYPWGNEAFETAKKLNRPVLLSVGYSTCHWCHVMEEESYEDEEMAR